MAYLPNPQAQQDTEAQALGVAPTQGGGSAPTTIPGSSGAPLISGSLTGASQGGTATSTPVAPGSPQPSALAGANSQAAANTGFTDVQMYGGNQSAINQLAGNVSANLGGMEGQTNQAIQAGTNAFTNAVTAGTPTYNKTATQAVTSNPSGSVGSANYGTVANQLLGSYTGPTSANPFYTEAQNQATRTEQAGQLLASGTPSGTEQYFETYSGISNPGNAMLNAYLLTNNPQANAEVSKAATAAMGAQTNAQIPINYENQTVIPQAQQTAQNTATQTQNALTSALNAREGAANQAVAGQISNYNNLSNEVNTFLKSPTQITGAPTTAQQTVLNTLGMTPAQWNSLVSANQNLQRQQYINNYISANKAPVVQNSKGQYINQNTGQVVNIPTTLPNTGINFNTPFSEQNPTQLFNLQNTLTPKQANDIQTLQTLLGQSSQFVNPNALTTAQNGIAYNSSTLQSDINSALQQAIAQSGTENTAIQSAQAAAAAGKTAGATTAAVTPTSSGPSAATSAATGAAAGLAAELGKTALTSIGKSIANALGTGGGVSSAALGAAANTGVANAMSDINASTTAAVNATQAQIVANTNAALAAQMSSDGVISTGPGLYQYTDPSTGYTYTFNQNELNQVQGAATSGNTSALEQLGKYASYAGAVLAVYNAVENWQSGATGPDTINGASAGAAVGTAIEPGIGTLVGAVIGAAVGALSSAFGGGKADPETTSWDNFANAYAKNPAVAGTLTPSQNYQMLSGVMDAKNNSPGHSEPMEQVFGRMGEQKFVDAMMNEINKAYASGQINKNTSSQDIWKNVVVPWMQSIHAAIPPGQRTAHGGPEGQALPTVLTNLIYQWMQGSFNTSTPMGIAGQPIAGLPTFGQAPNPNMSPTGNLPQPRGGAAPNYAYNRLRKRV